MTFAPALPLQNQANWFGASRFGANDYSYPRPKTGWAGGYYTIDNKDGTVSGPAVMDGCTCWIQTAVQPQYQNKAMLYQLKAA